MENNHMETSKGPGGHLYSIDGTIKCWCGDYHVEVQKQ